MTHEVDIPVLLAAITYSLITATITTVLIYNRIKRDIRALNYPITIFGLISITGILQSIQPFLHETTWLFGLYSGDTDPLFLNPVRNTGLLFMIITYFFSERMLRKNISPTRFAIMISALFGYIFVFIYYLNSDYLIRVNDMLPFAQPTRLDELFYDIILLESLISITFVYYLQYRVSDDEFYKRHIYYIFIGFVIFLLLYFIEISEHFLPVPDIDYVFFTLPLFLILGYVYLKYPNFIFYTPIDVHLLQISTISGHLLYATEFRSRISSRDYLISIGLSGLNNMLREIVDPETEGLTINSIDFDKGVILFEKLNELVVIIQADRESYILREGIKHLILEFKSFYGPMIKDIEGGVVWNNFDEIDDLLVRCIPMIQSKIILPQDPIQ